MASVETELNQLACDFQSFRVNRLTPLARFPSGLWDRALDLAGRLSVRAVAKAVHHHSAFQLPTSSQIDFPPACF
jgi:hypothetical protein